MWTPRKQTKHKRELLIENRYLKNEEKSKSRFRKLWIYLSLQQQQRKSNFVEIFFRATCKVCQGLKIDERCTCVGITPQRDYLAKPCFHLKPSVLLPLLFSAVGRLRSLLSLNQNKWIDDHFRSFISSTLNPNIALTKHHLDEISFLLLIHDFYFFATSPSPKWACKRADNNSN